MIRVIQHRPRQVPKGYYPYEDSIVRHCEKEEEAKEVIARLKAEHPTYKYTMTYGDRP